VDVNNRPISPAATAKKTSGATAGTPAGAASAYHDPAATPPEQPGQATPAGQRVRSFVASNFNTLAVLTTVVGVAVAIYDFDFSSKSAMHGSASAAHLLKHFPAAVAACEKSGNPLCQIPNVGLGAFKTMHDPMVMSNSDHHTCLADLLLGISQLAPEMLMVVAAALAVVIYLRCPR
jgi:hypothetical protein